QRNKMTDELPDETPEALDQRLAELNVSPPLNLRGVPKPADPNPLGSDYEGQGDKETEFAIWTAEKQQSRPKGIGTIVDDPAQNPPLVQVDGHGEYKNAQEGAWDVTKARYDANFNKLIEQGVSPDHAHALLRAPEGFDPVAKIGAGDPRPEISQKDGR